MIATVNNDCTQIVLSESNRLDTFIGDSASYTLSLVGDKTCCNNEVDLDILISDENIATSPNTYTVLPSFFTEGATEFTDGIYEFRFELTETSSGTVTSESVCVLVDCSLNCVVFDVLNNEDYDIKTQVEVAMIYEVLQNNQACDDCVCLKSCRAYNRLVNLLNSITSNCITCGHNS